MATPYYTATSTVLVDPRRATSSIPNQPLPSSVGSDDATVESQAMLIRSVSLLRRVVERLKLTQDAEFVPSAGGLDWLKVLLPAPESTPGASGEDIAKAKAVERLSKRLKVLRQRTTFLIDISATSRNSVKAAAIANAVADAYFLEQVRSRYDTTKIASDWLNQQIDALKTRVLASDKAVEDFRAATI